MARWAHATTWLVVPLVFCENRNIGVLKQAFEEELGFAGVANLSPPGGRVSRGSIGKANWTPPGRGSSSGNGSEPQRSRVFENIDGIKFLLHEGGCRRDSRRLQQSMRADCGIHKSSQRRGSHGHSAWVARTHRLESCVTRSRSAIRISASPLVVLEQQQSGTESAMLSDAIQQTFLAIGRGQQGRALAGCHFLTFVFGFEVRWFRTDSPGSRPIPPSDVPPICSLALGRRDHSVRISGTVRSRNRS